MVDDLLDLRKVESGKLQLRVEKFNVTDLFGALRGMFKPLSIKDTVSLSFEEIGALPDLYTDQGKVSQILRNLISNALKFTEAGSVRVTAKLAADTDMIVFSVADTGIGIARGQSSAHLRRIHPSRKPAAEERERHRPGPATVAEAGGACSAAPSMLPASWARARCSRWRSRCDWNRRRRSGTPAHCRNAQCAQRVLIVDDSEIERYALRQFLSSSTFEVIEATGGYDGLRLARQSHPDLIFLDLAMPDVHGLEVLEDAQGHR